jgi:hypothetical protein
MTNLETILSTVNGATFISMDTTTTPTLLGGKANPMKGRIRKHNTGANIMVFQNKASNGYDNMVKRRLEKEGKEGASFKLSPRKWGTRVPNLPIVEHKGAQYLEVIFLKSGHTSYTLDGDYIDAADIQGLNDSKPEGTQGGLNDKVIIRTFKVASIDRLKVGGKQYTRADLQG